QRDQYGVPDVPWTRRRASYLVSLRDMNPHLRSASTLALLCFAACAAPNPTKSNEPAAWRPPAETAAPKTEPTAPAKEVAKPKEDATVGQVAATATPVTATPAAAPAAVEPIVARVAGQP